MQQIIDYKVLYNVVYCIDVIYTTYNYEQIIDIYAYVCQYTTMLLLRPNVAYKKQKL